MVISMCANQLGDTWRCLQASAANATCALNANPLYVLSCYNCPMPTDQTKDQVSAMHNSTRQPVRYTSQTCDYAAAVCNLHLLLQLRL